MERNSEPHSQVRGGTWVLSALFEPQPSQTKLHTTTINIMLISQSLMGRINDDSNDNNSNSSNSNSSNSNDDDGRWRGGAAS